GSQGDRRAQAVSRLQLRRPVPAGAGTKSEGPVITSLTEKQRELLPLLLDETKLLAGFHKIGRQSAAGKLSAPPGAARRGSGRVTSTQSSDSIGAIRIA